MKSFTEKLNDNKDLPRVVPINEKLTTRWGTKFGDTVVIPRPLEVDELMKKVPKGKVITINQIREAVAKKYQATIGCPITCGIFARIAAGAADEEAARGKKRITSFWRTLKSDGSINEKYPGGIDFQKQLLEQEGHKVIKKGKKYIVQDFQKSLAKI